MIDEFSTDRAGLARFSDDRVMRYRLARVLTRRAPYADMLARLLPGEALNSDFTSTNRVVFLLLNPSTADAFKLDPTVKRCVAFARSWQADVIEVVNIFALRSTDPEALYKLTGGLRGDDPDNDREILAACTGATRVVAGWGKHGALGSRSQVVRRVLADRGIRLHHLGMNKDGSPKHPLYVKGSTEPQEWTT